MPHPLSVLDTSIETYNQAFFNKLADMEFFTYENSTQPKYDPTDPQFTSESAGFDEYSPFWSGFNSAILSYLSGSISRDEITDFLLGLFVHAHATIVRQRGNQQLIDNSSFDVNFSINGLVQLVLSRDVDFYDDYVAPTFDDGIEVTSESASRLQSDTAFILGDEGQEILSAYEIDKESWANLVPQYTTNTAANAVRDVYEGVDPSTFGPDLTPIIAYELVFDTLNWSTAFDVLSIDLPVPERPTQ